MEGANSRTESTHVFNSSGMRRATVLAIWFASCGASVVAHGENRSIDGIGNNLVLTSRGAANTPVIRITYRPAFANGPGGMLADAQRPNARTISNAVSAQSTSIPSARGVS